MRLIHFSENKLMPIGGPAGYLWNLRQGLTQIDAHGYEFLPNVQVELTSNKFLQRVIPGRVKEIRRLHNVITIPNKMVRPVVDYSEYEAIHFHSTEDLYLHRGALERYRGKVILTSHSPLAYHKELISRLNTKDIEANAEELGELAVIDEYAFRRADYVFFPCPEAEEPYFHTWEGYAAVRDEAKMRYVATGITPARAKLGREALREHYGIPRDAFVVTYVGRHNQRKGYDLLQSVASELLADEDVWFLVAGSEGPIQSLSHPRWVEIGWTDDPHSVIAASDVFVLPNRETFFDLIMLEALSLGQIVVASRTGGNKYFEKYACPGIRLYNTTDEMIELLRDVRAAAEDKRAAWRLAAKALFEQEFTVNTFAKKYDAVMNEICNG